MEKREFVNEFSDYDEADGNARNKILTVASDGKIELTETFVHRLHENIARHLNRIDKALVSDVDDKDHSVYTGVTGIALLYFHMYNVLDKQQDDRYLNKCRHLLSELLRSLKGRRISFLCGDAGPLALGAVVYHKCSEPEKSAQCLERLHAMHHRVTDDGSGLPDELLYGRSGYLFALMFVQKHLGPAAVDTAVMEKVYKATIQSGERFAQQERSPCPLMYAWHDKKYLGAAHGITGILHTLLQMQETKYKAMPGDTIQRCIDYLMTLKFASGNYPSSFGNETDRLVHWCHGAPGWIHMFVLAYKVYKDEKYLLAARQCSDVIWSRGILKKGYGICHGVAGNAYAFVTMYNLTAEAKYLYRACKFAEWCFDYGKHGCRNADRPWSLFEGLAGTVYFLTDLLEAKNGKFPAFVL